MHVGQLQASQATLWDVRLILLPPLLLSPITHKGYNSQWYMYSLFSQEFEGYHKIYDDHNYSVVMSKKYFSSESVTEMQHPPSVEPHNGGAEQNNGGAEQNNVTIQVKNSEECMQSIVQ